MKHTGYLKKIIEIKLVPPKAEFKYEDCEFCAFHNEEPGICADCDDGSEFVDIDDEEASATNPDLMKVAA